MACAHRLVGIFLRGGREQLLREANAAACADKFLLAALRTGDYASAEWVAAKFKLGPDVAQRFVAKQRGCLAASPRCPDLRPYCAGCDRGRTASLLSSEMESEVWLLKRVPQTAPSRLRVIEGLLCAVSEFASVVAGGDLAGGFFANPPPEIDPGLHPLSCAVSPFLFRGNPCAARPEAERPLIESLSPKGGGAVGGPGLSAQKPEKAAAPSEPDRPGFSPDLASLEFWLGRAGWALGVYERTHGPPAPAVFGELASALLGARAQSAKRAPTVPAEVVAHHPPAETGRSLAKAPPPSGPGSPRSYKAETESEPGAEARRSQGANEVNREPTCAGGASEAPRPANEANREPTEQRGELRVSAANLEREGAGATNGKAGQRSRADAAGEAKSIPAVGCGPPLSAGTGAAAACAPAAPAPPAASGALSRSPREGGSAAAEGGRAGGEAAQSGPPRAREEEFDDLSEFFSRPLVRYYKIPREVRLRTGVAGVAHPALPPRRPKSDVGVCGVHYSVSKRALKVKPWVEAEMAEAGSGRERGARFVVGLLSIKVSGGGHANALVFDLEARSLTRFEPHGSSTPLYDQKPLDEAMRGWLGGLAVPDPPSPAANLGGWIPRAGFLPGRRPQSREAPSFTVEEARKTAKVFGSDVRRKRRLLLCVGADVRPLSGRQPRPPGRKDMPLFLGWWCRPRAACPRVRGEHCVRGGASQKRRPPAGAGGLRRNTRQRGVGLRAGG